MTDQEFNQLREASWQRPLDPAEDARARAHLAANPGAQQDWELDTELTQLLAQVPDAPVPSNFTHQVLAAVDRDARLAASEASATAWWRRWGLGRPLVRLAGGMAVVLALTITGYHHQQNRQQEQLTEALLRVTHAHGLSQPSLFQDFEAIQRLGQVPQPADEELWLVLNPPQPR